MEVLQKDNQYIIKIPVDSVDAPTLNNLLRGLRLQEILAQRKGTDENAEALAYELNGAWWEQNKHRFLHENAGR